MDQIRITGITAIGRHGVFDHEQATGQPFVVDASLGLDLSTVAVTDDLADTVDYAELSSLIAAEIEGDPLRTIEALADRIAQACLSHARVREIEITVHKPKAPMSVPVTDVSVTVRRSQP